MNSNHIRVFSYAVGPHPLPVTALKEIACDTNGSYTIITAMGAIRTQIQVCKQRINYVRSQTQRIYF